MDLSTEKTGAILIVSVAGQINSANATGMETALLGHIDQDEGKMLLDLSRLDYISSAGLRVILMVAKRLKQQAGALVLCGLQPQVREVFDISGFLAFLTVVDTRPEGIAKLG